MQPSVRASVQVAQENRVHSVEAVESPVLTRFSTQRPRNKQTRRPWPALLQPWLNHHCGLLPTLGMPLKQLRGLPSSLSETKPRSVLPTATVPLGTYMGLCHPPPPALLLSTVTTVLYRGIWDGRGPVQLIPWSLSQG